VTRLGSLAGFESYKKLRRQLLTVGVFNFFGLYFTRQKLCIKFDQKMAGIHFGLFRKLSSGDPEVC
jgi:sugar phosphate permease